MRILISGGSGFLGRHLARELIERGHTVCIYSRDEVKHAAMMREFENDPNLRWFLGDVRDAARLSRAMRGCDAVIHAAALKRIETGHYNPSEMVATNIIGTQNAIDAAAENFVKMFVFVSSDKAFQPVSPYGQSKALAESLTLNANHVYGEHGPTYRAVRYGNVCGSTGSIIPLWREILKTSDTVPVTDPECTRFWMTAQQAVEFVLRSVFELAMDLSIPELPAFTVGDLAEAMGAKMNIIGLPKWEKRHESMSEGNSSDVARRMSVDELREALKNV
ncbi:MAG: SDR family NAD(P)-dependent oxidoreductase [Candidatus Methylomirabilota bacterium]